MPVRPSGVLELSQQADVLSDVSRQPGQHPESGDGEGGVECEVSVQAQQLRLQRLAGVHREGGARGDVRVPAVFVPVPGRLVQVAGRPGAGDAASDGVAQVDHDAAGRGHCVPGDGHQSARCGRLGDDAVVLRASLHAGAGEAGEVRRPSAVLRDRAADWVAQGGGELCVPAGAERPSAAPDVGGDAALDTRGCGRRDQQLRLLGVRHIDCATVCG